MIQETLSIRLSTDGFSFSIYSPDVERGHVTTDCPTQEALSLTANLKQVFSRQAELLSQPYRKVNLIMSDNRYALIPLEFYDDEQAESVFYQNHARRDNEIVLSNILRRNNLVVLFAMDRSLYSYLNEQFAQAQFFTQATPMIEYLGAKSRLGNNNKLYVQMRRCQTDLYAFNRNRLQLANTYATESTMDRLYYILHVWKSLRLDQERDELHLCGELGSPADKDALLNELRRYVRQVFIMNPSTNLDLEAIITCE